MFVLAQSYIISLNDDLWASSRIIRDMYESFADSKEAVEVMKLRSLCRIFQVRPLHSEFRQSGYQKILVLVSARHLQS